MAARRKTRTKTRTRTRTTVGRRRHRVSGTVAGTVGRTRHHRRRSVAKTTHRRKTRKRGFLGATGTGSGKFMQIAEMAIGVGIGAVGTHMLLRPLEHKVSEHMPMAAKFMGAAEIALGGFVALKAKNNFMKSIGIGVLAGGVHTVMHQLPIGLHSPAVNGLDDMSTLNVPINGSVQATLSGLIQQDGYYTRTPVVGASVIENGRGPVHTDVVSGYNILNSSPVVGEYDDDDELLFMPKGMRQ